MSTTEPAPVARLLTPAFVCLIGAELAYFTAQGALLAVVPLFVVERLGAGATVVGLVVGTLSATALLLRPLAGWASDRWGPRLLLLAGAAVATAAAAAHVLVGSVWQLVLLRVALGAGEAVFLVASVAVLAGLAPPGRRGEALSYSSLGLYLGIALGPALGEALLRRGGFDLVWAGVTLLCVLAGLASVRVRPGAAPGVAAGSPQAPRRRWSGRDLRRLAAPTGALTAGVTVAAGFLAFAALHARSVGLPGAGLLIAVYGGVVIASRLGLASLVDRGRASTWAVAALGTAAAGLAVMAASPVPSALYAGTVLLAAGVAVLTPAGYRLLVEADPGSSPGSVAVVFTLAVDLGLGAGPVVFGLLAAGGGTSAALAGGAVLALVGGAVALLARPGAG